jgi:hypothetical protein
MSLVGLDWGTNLRPHLTWYEYTGHYTTGEVSPPFTAIQQIWILIRSKIKKLYFIFQGDSGGPLVCLNNEGRWEVLGVSSFGVRGCFTDHIPNIYQSLPHNSDWIAHHTGKYALCVSGLTHALCNRTNICFV